MKKILIMGLPGAGKTTLAEKLKTKMLEFTNVVHFNADAVRENINRDLGFSEADRLENARRFGWLADRVVEGKCYCLCDFVCPTVETRKAFQPDVIVFIDTIRAGRFEDTNKLFVRPSADEAEIFIEINEYLDDMSSLIGKLL